MHPLSSSCSFLLAAMLALPAGARTDDADPGAGARPPQRAPAAAPWTAPAPAPQADSAAGIVADDVLAGARGGSDQTTIDTKLTGSVSGNSATNVSTGANIIQGGSFANMTGIPIVVQNSGANVLIQNATVINLQLK